MQSEENSYRQLLEDCILNAISAGADSFADVCRSCKGAFPVDVLSAMRSLQQQNQIVILNGKTGDQVGRLLEEEWWPEPSPVNYEWRFSRETAEALGRLAFKLGGKVLCLGTPTVFDYLIREGADVVLIDRNPFITDLFRRVSAGRVFSADVLEPSTMPTLGDVNVVVMDPPWYLESMVYWFKIASELIAGQGTIISPVFQDLVRPAARQERTALFEALHGLGSVNIPATMVIYDTPLFEKETLSALGVPSAVRWRVTELVILNLSAGRAGFPMTPPAEEKWEHVRFGTQLVAFKASAIHDERITVRPPYEDGSYLLKSVSARDPVRQSINLWTSRNRAAVTTGGARVAQFLRHLAGGMAPRDAIGLSTSNRAEVAALEVLVALVGH